MIKKQLGIWKKCVIPPRRCAALDMCTAILRGMKIIVTIPKAAPVVTVARTTIIPAWGISQSTAMVMAAAIRMSMQQSIMMTAAVAMTTLRMRSITTRMKSMRMMNAAVGTSIIMSMKSISTMSVAAVMSIIMSMKSMSTMSVAAVMSIIMSTHIMFRGIPMTANVKFAILTRSTAMFVAKA